MSLNRAEIKQILDLSSVKSIYEVIGRMEVLLDLFATDRRSAGITPFLHTYYLVTKLVAEKYVRNKDFYEEAEKLEKLDIHFAQLFFEPLSDYLFDREVKKPWQIFFAQIAEPQLLPFAKLLLGINAHINGDLAHALALADASNHKDFLKINAILQELIPEVMRYLAVRHRDLFGFGGLMLPGFTEREFHKIITTWRADAWMSYQMMGTNITPHSYRSLHNQTELLATNIVELFMPEHSWESVGIIGELEQLRLSNATQKTSLQKLH